MDKKRILLVGLLTSFSIILFAQFHTVKMPKTSPHVRETQTIGITDITIDYHSPAVRGRNVWDEVVGSYNDPDLPWRAGANMNTRITFSTDVTINGSPLKAGAYGFHILMKDNQLTLLFAHHDNQWGSYYLDLDEHVTLKKEVVPQETNFSEQLDYEFINRTDSTVVIALEWGEKRIPFTIGVDLNSTVIENFRYELLGINTYQWEAWNDAAMWCFNRNTNLEEALEWANRSINGGYNGFSANKNITNMTTKIRLLNRLGMQKELNTTLSDAMSLPMDAYQAYDFSNLLNRMEQSDKAIEVVENALDKYNDAWFLSLNQGVSYYLNGNSRKAISILSQLAAPDYFKPRLQQIIKDMKDGKYQLPG